MKKEISRIIILSSLNLIFPIIGFFINSAYYLKSKVGIFEKKILYFNISFSMAFIGFLYMRSDNSGDVYRYGLSLYYYGQSMLNGRENIIEGIYESFYPVWYFILYITNKLNLDVQFINFIAGFTIYSSFLYLILQLDKKYMIKNVDKILFVKVLLVISFIGIYSSYKTLWAFSIISLGLYFLMNKKYKGYIFIFLGIGLHPIAIFPMIIYFISKYVRFKIMYLYISLGIGILLKSFVSIFNQFLSIPFIGSKINSYIYGDWGQYRFQDNGEYVKFFLLVVFVLFIFYIVTFKFVDFKTKDKYFIKYNNFILWYFAISLWFISFRTVETRLLIEGVIFFFPLFYQLLLKRKIYKKNFLSFLVLIIWVIFIDIRTFNFWNVSYQIGSGFPYNFFESPILILLKGSI